jgi:dipeptidyl aminopeptidase/acylaminoacyl peptidase
MLNLSGLRALCLAAAGVATSGFASVAWADPAQPVTATPVVAIPPRISTADFAARATMSGLKLSPDGTHVIARAMIGDKASLGIFDLTGKDKPIGLAETKGFDTNWYRWAGNSMILVGLGKSVPWEGDEAYATRLVAYDLVTRKPKLIGEAGEGLLGDDVLWVDPEGKHILLSYQKSIYDYPSVSNIDLATNKSTQVVPARDDIWDWSADEDGVVRYGFGYTNTHHWIAVYRKTASDRFVQIGQGRNDKDNGADFDVIRIVQGSDDGFIYDTDEKTGLKAVYTFNFATHKRGDLVFEAPANDVDVAYTTTDGKAMESAWFTDSRQRVHWWNKDMAAFQADLDKAVNGGKPDGDREAYVQSQSRDRTIRIVWVGAANDPGSYYVYQEASGRMQRVAHVYESLHPDQLAKPAYVHYKARDGLDIPAYLTLPLGRTPKNLPLIIMPHGGPFYVRDDGSYDDDVQFLANRGYAVLQPQYRGSSSYGTAYHDKGKGQWGRAMQDDVDDGMDWLVKQGIADPKRVCLVGISYGGYAALWGATRNPERYRCGVSLAGVTDIGRQVKYANHFDDNRKSRDEWQQTVQGEKSFDLKTVSPLYTVDRLKVPVLVLHGEKDQRVLPKQSRLYADALKAAGKTFEYVSIPEDGHGYTTAAAARIWYDRLDAFLAKYNAAE